MNNDTTFDFEKRTYVNPQTGLTESESFIDTLRDVQGKNTAQINQNTYNLGNQVPSNVGGLGGSERLWQAQYQTPQTDTNIANLRATAQANALNQATQNLSDIYQNRYKQALRNYYARAKSKADATSTNPTSDNSTTLEIDTNTPTPTGDLAVEVAPVSIGEDQLNQNAFKKLVYGATSSGQPNMTGSAGLKFTQDGKDYYVVLYRDKLGNTTGGKVNLLQGGKVVGGTNYTANGIQQLLNNTVRSGNRLYDVDNVDITSSWMLGA